MSGKEPATQITLVESPQMVSNVKLPILKNGEYTLWSMRKSNEYQTLSKKKQRTVLKHQFENFSVSDTEGLDKAYDRFQKLIILLEVHGAAVPNEDANQKFLRALPSSWNYNGGPFISAEDTSSSNEVNIANSVSTASGHNSQGKAYSSSYTDDLMLNALTVIEEDNDRMTVPVETSDALVIQDNALIVQYGPTINKTSASVSQVETSITPPRNTSVEMPRVESVRPSGVIIEDWVSDMK
ncbi:hypothetical protein Tco_0702485 [Tanacetum coccineum]|uniref:Uncharacterized protein n=1 Tax=Tanacetum coccineum TaxID=301880 RepID=A0ABQ4XWD9_9ASTR